MPSKKEIKQWVNDLDIPDGWEAKTTEYVDPTFNVKVDIEADEFCDSPADNDDGFGTFISFGDRHSNYMDAEEALEKHGDNKNGRILSYFEHGSCMWTMASRLDNLRPDWQWDGVSVAGLWIPSPNAVPADIDTMTEAEVKAWYDKDCRTECETYTDWCNGQMSGYTVTLLRPDGTEVAEDSCWGFYNSQWEHIVETIKDAAQCMIEEYMDEVTELMAGQVGPT